MDHVEDGAQQCDLPRNNGAGPDGQAQDRGRGELIYGKDGCPHTGRARQALPEAEFVDVLAQPDRLEEMLALTGGVRRVPVIRRGETVEIGFRRGS